MALCQNRTYFAIILLTIIVSLTGAEIKNKGWWKNTVFYQIYPRSFFDSNNDGIGDLKGVASKLEYFVESGIGGIWLSPIYTSPMIDFGYDIADFRQIADIFGTMQDFEVLIQKAKKLGIRVVLDFVPNHTSDKHQWFIKSFNGNEKYKDYYIWREGKANNTEPPNNWISQFTGPAWKYNATRGLWYLHQFEYRQPDLNYSNPNVREDMNEVLRFWLNKGVDGFRIDAVPFLYEDERFPDEPRSHDSGVKSNEPNYLRHIYTQNDPRDYNLIRSWRQVVDEWTDKHNEDEKIIMTEVYANIDNTTKYYNYGSNVPFNFQFITQINNNSQPNDYKQVIDEWLKHTPKNDFANWVIGNHDQRRVASRFPGRGDQMIMLSMILPGVAITYNGDEIGMNDNDNITWQQTQDPQACNTNPQQYQSVSRDPARTPFQWDDSRNAGFSKATKTWLPINENYKVLNLARQQSEPQSHYKLYQTLTSLKNNSLALKQGDVKTLVLNEGKVLAVIRQWQRDSVILLINFYNHIYQSVNLSSNLPGFYKAIVIGSSVESDIEWGSTVYLRRINLPPKASVVLVAKQRYVDYSFIDALIQENLSSNVIN